jgi:hypothetical protein
MSNLPCDIVSFLTRFKRRVPTISHADDLQNSMCPRDAAFANQTHIPKTDNHGSAACTVPEGTTDTVRITHHHGTEQSGAPEPGLCNLLE